MRAEASEQATSPYDPLLARLSFEHARTFYPLGVAVTVSTDSLELLRIAEQSWEGWPVAPTDRHVQLQIGVAVSEQVHCPLAPVYRAREHLLTLVSDHENYVVADMESGMAFGWVSSRAVQHPLFLRYHFLEAAAMSLLCTKYFLAVHAACVSKNGSGLLLCGESGAGKSTLAYACARAGWVFTSDDASYFALHPTPLVATGNASRFRFRPEAKDLFPELAPFPITPRAEGKPSVEVDACALTGITTASETRITAILHLERGTGKKAHIQRIEGADLLPLFEGTLCYPEQVMRPHRGVIDSLLQLPCYRLEYDDLSSAIDALDRFAESFTHA